MRSTDTSEQGVEKLMCKALSAMIAIPPEKDEIQKPTTLYGGFGWV